MQNYRSTQPNTPASGDPVKMSVLPNGVTVATMNTAIHTVHVSVFANVGSRFETEQENGLSHFLEHMAFKGTTTRSARDISWQIERLGSDINAFTSQNATAYFVTGLPNHISSALDILSDVLTNSVMAPEEIAREQDVVVQEIHQYNDDIDDIAFSAFNATAFPDQPTGRHILGSEENVRSFDNAILSDYMNRHYHAGGLIVMAIGRVDHDEFVAEAQAKFGNIAMGETRTPVPATYVGGTTVVKDDRYDQAHLYIGFPAPGTYSPDIHAYDLLSDILGSGMSSPLFQEVREKRGLCYSVGAGVSQQPDHSMFLINGSTTADKVDEFLVTSCNELVKIAKGEIEDSDWERARNQIINQVVTRFDSTTRLARTLADDFFNLGRIQTMDEIIASYMEVTREQIIASANALLLTKPTIVVAGNAADADYEALVTKALTI